MKHQGFSLFELMIIIAIIGIIAGIGYPSLEGFMNTTRSEGYMKSLSRQLAAARHQAVASGRVITLCPLSKNQCTNDWSLPVSLFFDDDSNMTKAANENVIRIINQITREDTLTYSGAGITFLPDGSIVNGNEGAFVYKARGKSDASARSIAISSAGKAEWHEGVYGS